MNYKKLLEKYNDEMLETLKEFCKIPSVYDESTKTKEKPFGENVDKALHFIGELGRRLGFSVEYCDGYATELTIGSGEKMIGIFAHADVVPASGKWTNNPFEPVVRDGNIYARGSSDDKGPLISALYATKALYEEGLIKNYKVRIVVGGDEERGSSCLEYYFDTLKKEGPDYGFTPDSDFPLIYGEKEIVDFYPEIAVKIPNVKSIKGGVATNAVCDHVEVEMKRDEDFINYLKEKNINFKEEGKLLVFEGQSCHGSTPELGVNAALICLSALGDFYKVESLSKIGDNLSDTSGKKFGCYTHSKLLGDSTYCVGMVNYEKEKLSFTVNFRYGETTNLKEIMKKFDEFFATKSEAREPSPLLLYDPKSTLVKTLLKAYRKETKDKTAPLTTGGGTYAKHAPNTIAFGALFPGRTSTMHEPDELMPLEDFYLSAIIYARAIDLLGKKL